jgi:hypothetical protein
VLNRDYQADESGHVSHLITGKEIFSILAKKSITGKPLRDSEVVFACGLEL